MEVAYEFDINIRLVYKSEHLILSIIPGSTGKQANQSQSGLALNSNLQVCSRGRDNAFGVKYDMGYQSNTKMHYEVVLTIY